MSLAFLLWEAALPFWAVHYFSEQSVALQKSHSSRNKSEGAKETAQETGVLRRQGMSIRSIASAGWQAAQRDDTSKASPRSSSQSQPKIGGAMRGAAINPEETEQPAKEQNIRMKPRV